MWRSDITACGNQSQYLGGISRSHVMDQIHTNFYSGLSSRKEGAMVLGLRNMIFCTCIIEYLSATLSVHNLLEPCLFVFGAKVPVHGSK